MLKCFLLTHPKPAFIQSLGIMLLMAASAYGPAANAAEKPTLLFRENVEYAPYLYRHQSANGTTPTTPQGYIPALLKYFADDHGVNIQYTKIPRNRMSMHFKEKKLDAAVLSEHWVDNPGDFVFSQPLALYKSVLFTVGDTTASPASITQIKSKYICAHRGYHYPTLNKLWEKNNLIRVDFSDEKLQLQGLTAGRCQYAVLDEAIGNWYIKRFFKEYDIKAIIVESTIPFTIGFRRDQMKYAQKFDATISRLKTNGELGILQRVFGVVTYKE